MGEDRLESVAAKLEQAELFQGRDEALLESEQDPAKQAEILARLASRAGQIAGYQRTLARLQGEEVEPASRLLTVRLPLADFDRLQRDAAEAGQTISQFVRTKVSQ